MDSGGILPVRRLLPGGLRTVDTNYSGQAGLQTLAEVLKSL